MRGRNRDRAASLVEETELEKAARWRREDARRAAAWLVRAHRASFRRLGAKDFYVPRGAELPPWFRAALSVLRTSAKWDVEARRRDDGGTGYRIRRKRCRK